jgi:MoaA/NifB/PqqE/SkfB family radical SAM enzyme
LKCKKCYIRQLKFKQELSTDEIFSLIEDSSRLGASYFSITGGEPLLREDIEKIGKKIKEEGMVSSLSTNGTLITKNRAEKLLESFDYIRISLDGIGELDDKLRGKGTFKRTCEGIEALTQKKDRNSKIVLTVVVGNRNYLYLEDFFHIFRNKVDFISFLPLSSRYGVFNNPDFINFLKEKKNKYKNFIGDIGGFTEKISFEEGKNFCDSGKLFAVIAPDGSVHSCVHPNMRVGSLKEKNIISIWKSDEMVKARERAKYCNGCYAKCHTGISKIFRMKPYKIITKLPELIRASF